MIGARLSVFRAERFRGPRAAGTRASVDRPVDYPADDLTPAERERIAPHFTDLDGPVFALVNLPETVKGALFARYSRYAGALRRLFLDELAASVHEGAGVDPHEGRSAAELHKHIFGGYGD